jgi:AmmeMemoRadiSam system protein B/AmmeMemoRadiSam system protein A
MKNSTITLLFILLLASIACADDIKDADLAGSWYPASGGQLKSMLQGYLDAADPEKIEGRIFAIISPHAGYQYSGPVAAYGFKEVRGRGIKTVILIGFSHKNPFDGIAVYSIGIFRTPLGDVKVDAEIANAIISKNKRILFYPALFNGENSVEMQVPFIQAALPGTMIVPIEFGTQHYQDAVILADALAEVLKGRDDCLIVASTDMSHYHAYDEANSMDARAIGLIEKMKVKDLFQEADLRICELCGIMPVTATMLAAEKLGFTDVKVLKYANSGDTAGTKDQVVGYLSAVVYRKGVSEEPGRGAAKTEGTVKKDQRLLNDKQQKRLLEIARESITSYVRDGKRKSFTETDAVLNSPMGAFVTLKEGGELRGCIGNMVGRGPLYKTVADMAIEAATGDPRFSTLSKGEIDKIDIEISVLSPMKKVYNNDEIKIPGHGVMVKRGFASGVYLPQVATETGWTKEEFMSSLCAHKAGLASDAWKDPATEIYTFTAEVFGEKGE